MHNSKSLKTTTPPGKKLNIEHRAIIELRAYVNNPRIHSKRQIKQIANSIQEYGFLVPILVDGYDEIIAGHARVEAARLLGLKSVPTIRVAHLSDAQRRAFIIADNKLATLSDWDRGLLKVEFEALSSLEIKFNLESTGFSTTEIDFLINKEAPVDDSADEISAPREGTSVSRTGDVWRLGASRLVMGDARDPLSYAKALAGSLADMVFTDVPYNVRIRGHVGGKGRISHREFAMASGEMSTEEFDRFLKLTVGHHGASCRRGALAYFSIDWRHYVELLAAARDAFRCHLNTCVWVKNNAGMGGQYRSQHELVPVFRKGDTPHVNNIELGRHGRTRTNVWHYDGASSFGKAREELELHPTVKPVKLVADAVLDATRRNDIVLDGFVGSGTTILAAERTGRRAAAIEIDGKYVDVAVERFQTVTGIAATLEDTGETYSQVCLRRLSTTGAEGPSAGEILSTPGSKSIRQSERSQKRARARSRPHRLAAKS